jgi:hypothetical protein
VVRRPNGRSPLDLRQLRQAPSVPRETKNGGYGLSRSFSLRPECLTHESDPPAETCTAPAVSVAAGRLNLLLPGLLAPKETPAAHSVAMLDANRARRYAAFGTYSTVNVHDQARNLALIS